MPIVYLKRRETFAAAHRLYNPAWSKEENERVFDKCAREFGHGHNYEIEVTLKMPVDPASGMGMHLAEIKHIIHEHVISKVDHRHLNYDVPALKNVNPTAENLVIEFWRWLVPHFPKGALHEVGLRETENNYSFYRGE